MVDARVHFPGVKRLDAYIDGDVAVNLDTEIQSGSLDNTVLGPYEVPMLTQIHPKARSLSQSPQHSLGHNLRN